MFRFINLLFTWWNGATIGTHLNTWFRGHLAGEDIYGNAYYHDGARKRRWVVYKGLAEASKVPPEWHGWLHHTVAEPPTVDPPKIKPWEKEHIPNWTGTAMAYRPPGSLLGRGERAKATGDYVAWRPE
jgi:NADH:ubiquinone oxidoreductase subunit